MDTTKNIKVGFDLNKMLTHVLNRNSYAKGLNSNDVEQYLMEGLAVALRFVEHYPQFFDNEYILGSISLANCLLSKKSVGLSIREGGFWNIVKCEISIDFLTGDIYVKDMSDKNKKYSAFDYGVKYKKPIDTSIVSKYLSKDYERKIVYWVDSKEEIKNILLNKEFTMYNVANNHKGELTVLNEDDIKNIVDDGASVFTNEDKTMLYIEYPHNVCKLERCILT